jgi:hypothetical protein
MAKSRLHAQVDLAAVSNVKESPSADFPTSGLRAGVFGRNLTGSSPLPDGASADANRLTVLVPIFVAAQPIECGSSLFSAGRHIPVKGHAGIVRDDPDQIREPACERTSSDRMTTRIMLAV